MLFSRNGKLEIVQETPDSDLKDMNEETVKQMNKLWAEVNLLLTQMEIQLEHEQYTFFGVTINNKMVL
jgi:hypothetical protein